MTLEIQAKRASRHMVFSSDWMYMVPRSNPRWSCLLPRLANVEDEQPADEHPYQDAYQDEPLGFAKPNGMERGSM